MTADPLTLTLRPDGERRIVMERRFAASPQRVFDAFTREDLVPRWMDTPSWPMTECRIDLRVGGELRYVWSGDHAMGMTGTFRAVEPPHRLEHVELFDEDWTGGEVLVVTEFLDEAPGTRVRMTLTYSSREARDGALESGMDRGLDLNYRALDDWLAGRQALFVVDPERDLVLERLVPVPPSRVWAAWTEPELLVRWFAPAPWTVASARVEAHPGGVFDVVVQSPEGEKMDAAPGCVLVADPGRLLVWTDGLGPGFAPRTDAFFTAIVRLTPEPAGTRYQVIVRHGDAAGRVRHEEMGFANGWGSAAEQMIEVLSSGG